MVIKYLFVSSGSHDGYYIHCMIVGKKKNIEKIIEEFKIKDKLFIELKKKWMDNHSEVSKEKDLESYVLWKAACEAYEKIIPKIAYSYDCTCVKIDEFNFGGMDV